jgi:S-layer homology domain
VNFPEVLFSESATSQPISLIKTPYTTGFIDIQEHFSKPYVEQLTSLGVISQEDNLFEPEVFITRAEFLKMIFKSQQIDYSDPSADITIFNDLSL